MALPADTFAGFLTPSDPRWSSVLGRIGHDFFHTPDYIRACSSSEEGEPLLLLVDAGAHGLLFPFFKRPLAPFGEAFRDHFDATSPYGYPGPILWGGTDPQGVADLFEGLEALFRAHRIVSLFVRLNPFLGPPVEVLAPHGEVKTHGPTIFIDLRDPEASWHGMNHQMRSTVTRTLREGSTVRFDAWETMDTVIQAYRETMCRRSASAFYHFPRTFFEILKNAPQGYFHLATSFNPAGNITGGAFFSEVEGLMHYFLTGTFQEFIELSPSKMLINALRLWGIEHGHHTLHLGGGLGANQDSLYQFKERFSKASTSFSTFRKILLPEMFEALAAKAPEVPDGFFPCYRYRP